MKKENKKKCVHNWQVIGKKYGYFGEIQHVFIFCHLCGEVKRIKVK